MGTYSYDSINYTPPAPTAEFKISTDISSIITSCNAAEVDVEMLIDTGADTSMIPIETIKALENQAGCPLPYGVRIVEDFNGATSTHKSYDLTILVQNSGFQDELLIEFLEIDDERGILGRDILNDFETTFNGPAREWTLIK